MTKNDNIKCLPRDDVRTIGLAVAEYMKRTGLTTEWTRTDSRFGSTDFTRFKKENCQI